MALQLCIVGLLIDEIGQVSLQSYERRYCLPHSVSLCFVLYLHSLVFVAKKRGVWLHRQLLEHCGFGRHIHIWNCVWSSLERPRAILRSVEVSGVFLIFVRYFWSISIDLENARASILGRVWTNQNYLWRSSHHISLLEGVRGFRAIGRILLIITTVHLAKFLLSKWWTKRTTLTKIFVRLFLLLESLCRLILSYGMSDYSTSSLRAKIWGQN